MSRRVYKTSIPANATEVVEAFYATGGKKSASCWLGGERVGHRGWFANGQLEYELPLRGGRRHGNAYFFYENGQVEEIQPYCKGVMHGTGKQWAEDGRLLVTWRIVRGIGLDLWCDAETGSLAEEHYWPRSGELGFTRHWNADERTIFQEYYYVLGKGYHGIWREWDAGGRPRRGFPRYYINDRHVTRRQYLRACEGDPTLPDYVPKEDGPHRELPAEFLAQRKVQVQKPSC